MAVYSVAARGGPWATRDFATARPGFEIALS
jgi:hypothetical protein